MTDPVGNVRSVPIEEELKTAYLDYAMSVIVSRALPDVRDGLKPVHRRILYTMNEMGLNSGASYRKCAATSHCASHWSTARATSVQSTATPPRP